MNDKLIEIAKDNGAKSWKEEIIAWDEDNVTIVQMTEAQLRATIEQVCAPLVEAMEASPRIHDTERMQSEAVAAYRTLIGDKE